MSIRVLAREDVLRQLRPAAEHDPLIRACLDAFVADGTAAYRTAESPAERLAGIFVLKYKIAKDGGCTVAGEDEAVRRLDQLGSEPVTSVETTREGAHYKVFLRASTLQPVAAVVMEYPKHPTVVRQLLVDEVLARLAILGENDEAARRCADAFRDAGPDYFDAIERRADEAVRRVEAKGFISRARGLTMIGEAETTARLRDPGTGAVAELSIVKGSGEYDVYLRAWSLEPIGAIVVLPPPDIGPGGPE